MLRHISAWVRSASTQPEGRLPCCMYTAKGKSTRIWFISIPLWAGLCCYQWVLQKQTAARMNCNPVLSLASWAPCHSSTYSCAQSDFHQKNGACWELSVRADAACCWQTLLWDAVVLVTLCLCVPVLHLSVKLYSCLPSLWPKIFSCGQPQGWGMESVLSLGSLTIPWYCVVDDKVLF